ncbi:MAG: hypothetical protein HY782_04510 [Chloroflexi bacterium]|nr:hypothetical protein [Chloroflexota bacterium]
MRHTQVLMALPIVVAVWPLPRRERLRFLMIAAAAALVVALPDLWYHQIYFGNWLAPESEELALFAWSSVLPSAAALSQRFLAGNEFGYLIPFLLYGIYRAARDDFGEFAVLAAWALVLGGFHLLYAAVKIRDLLPEYPAVILLTAYGMVALARDVSAWAAPHPPPPIPLPPLLLATPLRTWLTGEGGGGARGRGVRWAVVALTIFLALLMPAMRDRLTILRPFQPAKVTFGYVMQAQRAAFDQIAALTPPEAVIGSTMNDGPIDLYARRATFRPGAWTAEEQARFIAIMQHEKRPVYLLDDGAETSAARREWATRYTLRRIAVLDVPLFGEVDGTPGAFWEISMIAR